MFVINGAGPDADDDDGNDAPDDGDNDAPDGAGLAGWRRRLKKSKDLLTIEWLSYINDI